MATLTDRIREALEKATYAFWEVIAQSFPEAESGDFGPEETLALEKSLLLAVLAWTRNNLPPDVIAANVHGGPPTVSAERSEGLSEAEWRDEVFKAWLANDQPRLAELTALVAEDEHGG